MARGLIFLALWIFLFLGGYQTFKLYQQRQLLKEELTKINSRLDEYNQENEQLAADIEYFKNPSNLEKELKFRFNYVRPGEKLLIVVPKQNDTGND